MILLEANQSLLFGGIPLTDWLQAIGAIIAIIAAIVGFIQLYKDSKEKQSQINTLTKLANESALQTNHLSSQVDEMIKGNTLLTENVNLIQRTVSIKEESLNIQHEKNELDKQQRKNEIKPVFTIIQHNLNDNRIILNLQVERGIAKFIKVEEQQVEKIHIIAECNHLDNLIPQKQVMELQIKSNPTIHLEINKINLNVRLFYKDINDNLYYQEIEGVYDNGLNIHEPIEITNV